MRQPLILPQDDLGGIHTRLASSKRMAANVSTLRGIPTGRSNPVSGLGRQGGDL